MPSGGRKTDGLLHLQGTEFNLGVLARVDAVTGTEAYLSCPPVDSRGSCRGSFFSNAVASARSSLRSAP